jgi:hypothetical protein
VISLNAAMTTNCAEARAWRRAAPGLGGVSISVLIDDDGDRSGLMTAAYPVALDSQQREFLQATTRSQTAPHRAVIPARILLGAATGLRTTAPAATTGLHVDTIRARRTRFGQIALAALTDAPRPARPTMYGPETRLRIAAAAPSATPPAQPAWTHRLLTDEIPDLGIPASHVGRILAPADLTPHRVRGWLTRPADPDFFTRAAQVCSVYRHHPPDAIVPSVNEKTRHHRPPPANTPTSPNAPAGHDAENSSTSATAPSPPSRH